LRSEETSRRRIAGRAPPDNRLSLHGLLIQKRKRIQKRKKTKASQKVRKKRSKRIGTKRRNTRLNEKASIRRETPRLDTWSNEEAVRRGLGFAGKLVHGAYPLHEKLSDASSAGAVS